jgi:protein involved in temperature-dependent protein secretion
MTVKIDSKEILYSKGSNDECYTPNYGVTPILEFIPKGKIIWCPFDKVESEFVKQQNQ